MPPKRKRNERGEPGGGRAPPYRPGETSLGQHDRDDYGTRQASRGGRGPRRSDRRDSRDNFQQWNNGGRPDTPTKPVPASSAAQNPPPPATATPSSSQAQRVSSGPPSPLPSNYHYDVVTDDKIKSWSLTGRSQVVAHGVQSRQDEDITELSTIYQEVIRSVFDRRLGPQDAGACVKEIVGAEQENLDQEPFGFNPQFLFLDTFSTFLDSESTPYPPQLRDFMLATDIPPRFMREILDAQALQDVGLLRETFTRMAIRSATNLLYRQANYNLLREETEGYSKLATELFGTGTEFPSNEMAHLTFERIKALVGTFDLDVGRVLDVTIDVAASMLIRNFKFFVKLFRASSWWPREQIKLTAARGFVGGLPLWALPHHFQPHYSPEEKADIALQQLDRDVRFWDRAREVKIDAFYELGGRQVSEEDLKHYIKTAADDETLSAKLDWIQTTKTLPPVGNRVAAQLLGFKLRFYQSEARGERDQIPPNISYLAALLIKIGFVSLVDIYPHLYPSDEDMEEVREKQLKMLEEEELKKRPGGGLNALMMAGALPDDAPTGPPQPLLRDTASKRASEAPQDMEKEKPKYKEPLEQKAQLLQDLLTIGAIPEALFFLGKFPWLFEAFPKVAQLIHRIIDHSIHKLAAEPVTFVNGDHQCAPKKAIDPSSPQAVVRKWANPDDPDHQGRAHRFYWEDWADNVPVCQTIDDLFTLCDTFVNLSGVNIGQDAALLAKLCRIGSRSLQQDESDFNKSRWLGLLGRLLVPALSLTKSNSSVASAVWDLLQQYPNTTRFKMYSDWYEGPISRLPAIQAAFRRTKIDTQNTMKRLSTSNILSMARLMAKTAFPSPGIVFKVALNQIEAYSNFIEAFVECARYFTPLGYDVLVWSLMISLGGNNRSRTQESSVLLTGKWLQALSRFSGKVFRRYSNLDPTPVLYYVNNQLLRGNSTDLIILKELIISMSGIVSDVDFTDSQLAAMTGGDILRERTLKALQDKRFEPHTMRTARRLMQALVDSGISGQLLINLAQYIQATMFNQSDAEAHNKFLANTVDETLQTLQLYLDLLRHNLQPERFDELVPDITRLLAALGLTPSLAFLICRGSISAKLHAEKALASSPTQDATVPSDGNCYSDGDVTMVDKNAETEAEATGPRSASPTSQPRQRPDTFLQVLGPIIDTVRDTVPEPTWKYISPEFFTIFWSLQLGDLAVPQEAYALANERCRKEYDAINKDRSRMTRKDIEDKRQQKEDLMNKLNALIEENKTHLGRTIATRNVLLGLKDTWFVGEIAQVHITTNTMFEQCVLPRLLISASDADYCYKMVRSLHDLRAPNFTLKAFFDTVFAANRLRSTLFVCTVREAQNLGRFLKLTLGDLAKWHGDKALFEKQALGPRPQAGAVRPTEKKSWPFFGFVTKFGSDGFPEEFVEHGHFRDLLFGWHKNLNMALKTCLAGSEWMHIRNAITVLKAVTDYFPAVDFMGKQFNEQLKKIHQREDDSKPAPSKGPQPRGDLSVAARTASAELLKKQSKWVIVQAFRPNLKGEPQEEQSLRPSRLRPGAPEFQPGTDAKAKPTTGEGEDGEVKDSKTGPKVPNARPSTPSSIQTGSATRASQAPNRPVPPSRGSSTPGQRPDSQAGKAISSKPTPPGLAGPSNTSRSDPPKPPPNLPLKPNLPSRPNVPFPDHFRQNNLGHLGQPMFPNTGHREQNPRDFRESPRADSRDVRGPERESRPAREHRTYESPRLDRPADGPSYGRSLDASPPREHGRSLEREHPPERSYPPSRPDAPRFERGAPERHGPDRPPGHDRDVRQSWDPREARGPPARGPDHRAPRDGNPHDSRTPRDVHEPARPVRESNHDSRSREGNPSDGRPRDLGPPKPPVSEGPQMNPERAALIGGRKEPERTGSRGDRSSGKSEMQHQSRQPPRAPPSETRSGGPPRDDHGDRRGSRRQSPDPRPEPRVEPRSAESSRPDLPRDDHSRHQSNHHGNSREHNEPRHRNDRGADKSRDSHSDTQPPRQAPRESEAGRLSYADPSYGRLNPIQSVADVATEIPSGPRGRGGRNNGRPGQMSAPPPRPDPRYSHPEPSRAASPERFPPTGPASSRPSRRGPNPSFDSSNNPGSAAPSPSGTTPHPDRLQNIAGSGPERPVPQGPAQGSHRGPGGPPRRSLPADMAAQRPAPPDPLTPTGPAGAADSAQLKRQFRPLSQLGMNSEGGGSSRSGSRRSQQPRGSLPGSDAQVLTSGTSPVSTPIHDRPEPFRRDTGPEHNASRFNPNGNGHSGRIDDNDRGRRDREREREGESRSGRPSRRSSRERSPHRERDGKDTREYNRDRRSGREADREPSSRRSTREPAAGSGREPIPMGPSGREPVGGGREPPVRHRDGGGHRNDDWVSGGRGGRGGPRPGEPDRLREPRDDRSSRKRRSEEGFGNPEREKRPRR